VEASAIRILMISGSLRSGSTNTALLATARAVAPAHVSAVLYDGLARLPHFNPDDDVDERPQVTAVAELRAQIGAANAVLFSTPEYAGGLPGSFKNLLDWTVGGGETYGKPVAWVNASGPAAPTGAADAHASLRKVLAYTGAEVVEAACARIPVLRAQIGADGLVDDASIRERIGDVLDEIALHVGARRAER
jgi:NAD(P)H-dependent FMN reductase